MSAATINAPVAVPERVTRIMRMLTLAAEAGLPCPTNGDLADAIGAQSISAGANAVALLESMGLIEVIRYRTNRVVKICATGASTFDMGGVPAQYVKRANVKVVKPETRATRERRMAAEIRDDVRGLYVSRDPCPRCGTRSDYGCSHIAASETTSPKMKARAA